MTAARTPRRHVTIRIDETTLRALASEAKRKGSSVSEVARSALSARRGRKLPRKADTSIVATEAMQLLARVAPTFPADESIRVELEAWASATAWAAWYRAEAEADAEGPGGTRGLALACAADRSSALGARHLAAARRAARHVGEEKAEDVGPDPWLVKSE